MERQHVPSGASSATAGRLDFSVSAYRGRDGFGPVWFEPDSLLTPPTPGLFVVGRLVERFPRFTMIAGDFETVRGDCTRQIIDRWTGRLSVVDVWAHTHCETVIQYAIMH